MSDSVDRVFVKAISTIRALSSRSNYGSLPRPPAESRIKLYGLYKQATEGDVRNVMPRPVGFTPEDEGAKKKWDAWKREEGLPKTEAKKRYIAFLIETMKVYASGTHEARELLNELEYLWDQIKDLPVSDDENDNNLQFPSNAPSFSHTDRLSNRTPSIGGYGSRGGGGIGGGGGPGSTVGSNLNAIYSHSRKNTMSLNDYVHQQRLQSQHPQPLTGHAGQPHTHYETGSQKVGYGGGPGSTYSAPMGAVGASNVADDFKNWQSEVNAIINRLTREFVNNRRRSQEYIPQEDEENDLPLDDFEIKKRKVIALLKVVGLNAWKFLKNFAVSLFTILFIVWCVKKNVVVKRTFTKQETVNGKAKKEMVINMILNTDENRWFIRLLNFVNSFVGFV
ncbi:Acyl CoA binding family protein [Candida parapsilosis]|uniref:ACB domain-containing protein n=2 Tax=Candida parapsilosis TaxID=5480 RepID=G8BJ69_CANPC|nr:uncharacterized protein CPAR2_404880 [Candida parapsilosis]KAF6045947.1 Acyl CoA binding family protein [Candida parapsilosis]KAF6046502.1 Acyl CoA binding family protein [Candida parapsilosis]KAF6051057.1 Acyl CoA binding family protein [Candida parapsilosis]KAF6062220.1 Acyl CoA binding family protein [Candida parapsilosis]CAD1812208.1 unnamed protein product [Candida parapsilosis]